MIKIKVILQNKGFLLPGSGEGSALINSDPVTTADGFPYIPGRTFKGLLKESVQEVLEIEGKAAESEATCARLFGEEGAKLPGMLAFRNLYLQDWESIQDSLPAYLAEPAHRNAFAPELVKAHFTTEIAQTAIGTDGIIKNRSLRNFRVIKPSHTFTGAILYQAESLPAEDWRLLERAAGQLRFAGSQRNRGFGEIKVTLDNKVAEEEATAKALGEKQSDQTGQCAAIRIRLRTQSETVLSTAGADQNTVSTDRYVRGSRVRGLIAEQLLKAGVSGANAHMDDVFHAAILSGKVQFRPAYPKGHQPIPLNLRCEKGPGADTKQVVDIFGEKGADQMQTQAIGGMGKWEQGKLSKLKMRSSARFHNSRLNRTAGRNMEGEEQGGIFYYEGLDSGQVFEGEIVGDREVLAALLDRLPQQWQTAIGKSRSTQYGDVVVSLWGTQAEAPEVNFADKEAVLLHFRSGVCLLNRYGMPAADEKALQAALQRIGIDAELAKAATKVGTAETWNGQWQSRSGKAPVFQEGSVFLLQRRGEDGEKWNAGLQKLTRNGLGAWKSQGWGWVDVTPFEQGKTGFPVVESKVQVEKGHSKNETLDGILSSYLARKRENERRLESLSKVKEQNCIPNHLLSRIEDKLDALCKEHGYSSAMLEAWIEWMHSLKGKAAERTLKKKKLYFKLLDFGPSNTGKRGKGKSGKQTANQELEEQLKAQLKEDYLAWKATFRAIRIRNKKSRQNGKTTQ